MIPGEVKLATGDIIANEGLKTAKMVVKNAGDRPIQVGSHFHFFEVNRYLKFARQAAFGMHLNIPSGTAVRFEPGENRTVELVAYSGKGPWLGANNLAAGCMNQEECVKKAIAKGFIEE